MDKAIIKRLEQFMSALEAQAIGNIPEDYNTPDPALFIADVRALIAEVKHGEARAD